MMCTLFPFLMIFVALVCGWEQKDFRSDAGNFEKHLMHPPRGDTEEIENNELAIEKSRNEFKRFLLNELNKIDLKRDEIFRAYDGLQKRENLMVLKYNDIQQQDPDDRYRYGPYGPPGLHKDNMIYAENEYEKEKMSQQYDETNDAYVPPRFIKQIGHHKDEASRKLLDQKVITEESQK